LIRFATCFATRNLPVAMVLAVVAGLAPNESAAQQTTRAVGPIELRRGDAYARAVWMPSAATTTLGGYRVSLGLARLNRVVLDGFGSAGGLDALVPVASLQFSRDVSVTLIPNRSGTTHGMVALQVRLGP
jgi:hypothetical protein